MREIKFRAWVKDEKKMVEVKSIHLNTNKTINYSKKKESENDLNYGNKSCKKGNYDLMQFTGLYDKNSKEIFEGDIVEYEHEDDKILYIVEWSEEGYYSIKKVSDKDWEDYIFCRDLKNFEVIGNIYENPDLLEVEK